MQYRLIFHVPGKEDTEQIIEQSMVQLCMNLSKPIGAWTENAGEYNPAVNIKQPIVKPDGTPMLENSIKPKEDPKDAIILELMDKIKELEQKLEGYKEGQLLTADKEPVKLPKGRYVKKPKQ
jgi:hypothetical protein